MAETAALRVLPGSATPCQRTLDAKHAWGRTLAVCVGPSVLGVRADSDAGTPLLESVLAGLRVPEYDDEVAPNFSAEIGDDQRPRRLFLAYRAHQVVARRHDRRELLADLLELLADQARATAPGRLAVLSGAVVTRSGEAVLVPVDVHRTLLSRRRQLATDGVRLLPGRVQPYDPDSGDIITGVMHRGVADALHALAPDRLEPTRLPVRTWCVGARSGGARDVTGADALLAAVPMVLNRDQLGMGDLLRGLRAAVLTHRFVSMPTLTSGAQSRALLDLV